MDSKRSVADTPIAPEARLQHDVSVLSRYRRHSVQALARLNAGQDCAHEGEARALLLASLTSLQDALFGSPYWAVRLRELGLSPRDLQSLEDLEAFPVLDRQTLGERWRELPVLSDANDALADAVIIRSSGSTGAPVSMLRDGYDLLHMWTVTRFWCQQLGVALSRRPHVVLLDTLPGGLEYTSALPTFEDGHLTRISTVRPDPLDRLLEADPDVLFSDPDGLHWLSAQLRVPVPALVLTSAQHFGAEQRAALAKRVAGPVVNYYAISETGPIAWECLQRPGDFHALTPDVWVESVGGELLITRLRASALPILRYRTGDTGHVAPYACCPCGYRGWTIRGFGGRRACHFVCPDGSEVDAWQLAWIFKHSALRDFRLTQTGAMAFRLEVQGVLGDSAGPDLETLSDSLRRALGVLGWSQIALDVSVVDLLTQTGRKSEPFVCACKRPGAS